MREVVVLIRAGVAGVGGWKTFFLKNKRQGRLLGTRGKIILLSQTHNIF